MSELIATDESVLAAYREKARDLYDFCRQHGMPIVLFHAFNAQEEDGVKTAIGGAFVHADGDIPNPPTFQLAVKAMKEMPESQAKELLQLMQMQEIVGNLGLDADDEEKINE
jgi:hypothetical protein